MANRFRSTRSPARDTSLDTNAVRRQLATDLPDLPTELVERADVFTLAMAATYLLDRLDAESSHATPQPVR